MENTIKA